MTIETAVTYGNPDNGDAVCVRVEHDGSFKVELWLDGTITLSEYFDDIVSYKSWLAAVPSRQDHDGVSTPKSVGLAPQYLEGEDTRWVFVDEFHADASWFDDTHEAMPKQFMLFSGMNPIDHDLDADGDEGEPGPTNDDEFDTSGERHRPQINDAGERIY